MRRGNSLYRDFKKLAKEPDKHSRGRHFEELIQRLLETAHYRVQRGAGVARPHQTDLFAVKDRDEYVIETKWRKDPANINDLEGLRNRLARGPNHLMGMLFSMSGFTAEMIADLETHRERVLLLFNDTETEALASGIIDLDATIREKRDHFVRQGRVVFHRAAPLRGNRAAPDRGKLPAPDVDVIIPDIGKAQWVKGTGDFGSIVFTEELPDVNWTGQGRAVGFELDLRRITSRRDLAYAMDSLRKVGWVSELARWSIQQMDTCWHGTGAAGLLDAIDVWAKRYREIAHVHHSEEVTYFDVCKDGFFTFTFLFSHGTDQIHSGRLSAQLYGVPLDLEPFKQLAASLRDDFVYFRPLVERTVRMEHYSPSDHRLEPVAFLGNERGWIEGIVAKNPFYMPDGRESENVKLAKSLEPLTSHELLCCSLSSHHEMGDKVDHYYLRRTESTWTNDAAVFHIAADWNRLLVRKHPISEKPRPVTWNELQDAIDD